MRRPLPETVTVHVPFRFAKRGGRKEMVLPEGAPVTREIDNTLVKALARAFRWKRMLESGEFATIAELAGRERMAPSYLTRVLRLTLLAPDVVEAILDGRQGVEVTLAGLLKPFSETWSEQVDFTKPFQSPRFAPEAIDAIVLVGQTGQKCLWSTV